MKIGEGIVNYEVVLDEKKCEMVLVDGSYRYKFIYDGIDILTSTPTLTVNEDTIITIVALQKHFTGTVGIESVIGRFKYFKS